MYEVRLNRRELATTLAALRLWQITPRAVALAVGFLFLDPDAHCTDLTAISTDDGQMRALDVDDIDRLCDRINSGPEV